MLTRSRANRLHFGPVDSLQILIKQVEEKQNWPNLNVNPIRIFRYLIVCMYVFLVAI